MITIRKLIVFLALCGILISFQQVQAYTIYGTSVSSPDYTGTRSSALGDGIITGGDADWLNGGFAISWNITENAGEWTYSYTINSQSPAISHFILEVTNTPDFYINTKKSSSDIEGPTTWTSANPSNPGLPDPGIYGIKFDFGGEPIEYIIVTDRDPVWGLFYGKGGSDTYAYSSGFNNINSDNKIDFIPRPDGGTPVPEPATLLLVGLGLISLANYGRKRL